MNSKLSKELRRYAAEMKDPTRPTTLLLAKPVRLKNGGTAVVAVNHSASERGIYLQLKAAVEKTPEILEQLRATISYKKMIAREQSSGGPTFEDQLKSSAAPIPGSETERLEDAGRYTGATYGALTKRVIGQTT